MGNAIVALCAQALSHRPPKAFIGRVETRSIDLVIPGCAHLGAGLDVQLQIKARGVVVPSDAQLRIGK
jgi:hypothetical protein